MTEDYFLRDGKATIITIASKDLVFRYLKHHCPDGDYSIEGPDVNCTLYRKDGIVYPSSGTIDGVQFQPHNLEECKEFFNR